MYLHVDLCCGLGGWQQPFEEDPQWTSLGLDIRKGVSPDVLADIRQLPLKDCEPTLITASPPCTQFSRWMMPWLDEPEPDMSLVRATLEAVNDLQPDWWVMENSRGLHQYWRPARRHNGAFYLWGDFPPFDVGVTWKGKQQTSGKHPDRRATIPYDLAHSLKTAVETWSSGH